MQLPSSLQMYSSKGGQNFYFSNTIQHMIQQLQSKPKNKY